MSQLRLNRNKTAQSERTFRMISKRNKQSVQIMTNLAPLTLRTFAIHGVNTPFAAFLGLAVIILAQLHPKLNGVISDVVEAKILRPRPQPSRPKSRAGRLRPRPKP